MDKKISERLLILGLFTTCTLALSMQSAPQNSMVVQDESRESTSVVIVLDATQEGSGALKTLKKAAADFADRFNSEDELAIFASAAKPTLVQGFTSDNVLLKHALEGLHPSGNNAVDDAAGEAVEYARSNAANDRHAVIVLSHELHATTADPASKLEKAVTGKPKVPVYFIVLGHINWQAQEWAQHLAVLSGGAAYFVASNSELTDTCQAVAEKLGATMSMRKGSAVAAPNLREYKTLLVRSVPVADNRKTFQFPSGDNFLLERMLVSRLQQARLFPQVIDAPESTTNTALPPGSGSDLELLATIIGYDRGHPGTPFGPTRLRVQVVLRDLATRRLLAGFAKQQAGPAGMFRGSQEKVEAQILIGMVNKIVEEIKDMKQHASP